MKDIAALHKTEYDTLPDVIASAPGVVKFLGEHAEIPESIVVAATLSFSLKVAVSARKDSSLRFFAADFGERKRATLGNVKYKREDRWANYPKAVFESLLKDGMPARGYNFTISGDIPVGLGLASSAALGIASALALGAAGGKSVSLDRIGEFVRSAESIFMERPVPAFDFIASASELISPVSLIDMKTARRKCLPFLPGEWLVIFTDSKVPRMSVDNEHSLRSEQIRRCMNLMAENGHRSLRNVRVADIDDLMGLLPESVRRRCIHVVDELARVHDIEDALSKGDSLGFGKAVNKSHASLRNLYEISCPEIDWLAKRAMEIDGIVCSRLTGKGFGGCTVSIMKAEALPEYRKRLEDYERIFGFRPAIYETTVSGGLKLLS